MKKVLILAYDFPPYVSVGGFRPYNWYKYMKEYGVYPIIITRQWDNKYGNHMDYIAPSKSSETIIEETEFGTIVKTPYKPNYANRLFLKYGDKKYRLLRKMISMFYEFFQFVIPIGPKSRLYYAAKEYIKKEGVDVIIATGEPFVLFKYAYILGKRYNIPWVADYRDPWSENITLQKFKVYKKWCEFFEKRIMKKASNVTTVSKFLKLKISTLTKATKVDVLTNGYDSEVVKQVEHIKQSSEKFSIAYVGTIYDWYPVTSFFEVCKEFISNHDSSLKFQVNFYGINKEKELKSILKQKFSLLIPYVTFYPKQSNLNVLKLMAKDNVFLLYNNYSFLGTKIFDYVALRRKIILCYTDDDESKELKKKHYLVEELGDEFQHLQENMIQHTNSGINVKNASHLLELINEMYGEFKTHGQIECKSVNIDQYSRKIQAKKLVNIINDL